MKNIELEELASHMLTEYYKRNNQPLYDILDDEVLWFGPRIGQVIEGKEKLIAAFEASPKDTIFTLGDIKIYDKQLDKNFYEILLEYQVSTHFETGEVHTHHQRFQLSFRKTFEDKDKKYPVYKAVQLNVSNALTMDSYSIGTSDTEESEKDAISVEVPKVAGAKIFIKGKNEQNFLITKEDIIYIESMDNGRHCMIHTVKEDIFSHYKLSHFTEEYPEDFLRVHSCYVINPYYTKELVRFKLTLSNGVVLPVPEKKYTAFKKSLKASAKLQSLRFDENKGEN